MQGKGRTNDRRDGHGCTSTRKPSALKRLEAAPRSAEQVFDILLAFAPAADPSRLAQTTVNLISNAMKFIVKSEKRQVRIRIDISLDKPEESAPLTPPSEPTMLLEDNTPIYLYIAVVSSIFHARLTGFELCDSSQHDTGPGLTEEELGKLFRRFSQANSDVHCQMGGSGLGLYIAKQLCGLQGGRIEAKSVLGEGAIFRFFIQAWSVASADGNCTPDRPLSVPLRMPSMAVNPANSLHILVCDDNIINRKTLARQLKQHKHNVVMAEDGQEALVCWLSNRFLAYAKAYLLCLERDLCLRESWHASGLCRSRCQHARHQRNGCHPEA